MLARELAAAGILPVNIVDIEFAIAEAIDASPSTEDVERDKERLVAGAGRLAMSWERSITPWRPRWSQPIK